MPLVGVTFCIDFSAFFAKIWLVGPWIFQISFLKNADVSADADSLKIVILLKKKTIFKKTQFLVLVSCVQKSSKKQFEELWKPEMGRNVENTSQNELEIASRIEFLEAGSMHNGPQNLKNGAKDRLLKESNFQRFLRTQKTQKMRGNPKKHQL